MKTKKKTASLAIKKLKNVENKKISFSAKKKSRRPSKAVRVLVDDALDRFKSEGAELKQPRSHKDVDFGQTLWYVIKSARSVNFGKICLDFIGKTYAGGQESGDISYGKLYFKAEDAAAAAIKILNEPQRGINIGAMASSIYIANSQDSGFSFAGNK